MQQYFQASWQSNVKGKTIIGIVVVVGVFLAATILFIYNPEDVSFYPRCPLKMLTGYDCPGCGTLRGLHAILHGDFSRAWRLNAALFFAIPAIVFFGLSSKYRVGSIAYRIVSGRLTPRLVFIAIIAWWICRNL
jgi:hypothetical protein